MARNIAGLSTGAFLTIVLILGVGYGVYSGYIKLPAGLLPGATVSQPGAQCAFTGGTTPPLGCSNMAIFIQFAPIDLYAQAALAASTYSIKVWTNTGGGWTSPEAIACGAAPTTCTTGGTYTPGTQMIAQLCKNQTPSCSLGDYGQQKETTACNLPSLSGSGFCGAGLGSGFVPWAPGNPSTAPTVRITFPVVLFAGAAQANNTPVLLTEKYQNGTAFTAASTCLVNTGAAACDLPKASSVGRFQMQWDFQQAGAGTNPANPQGAGYATFTDPSFTTSSISGRGLMQTVLSIEVKATTNNDMCTITSPTFGTVSPIKIAKSNSATDLFYIYVLPDSALTRTTDSGGNVLQSGDLQANLNFDCNAVYNGSGDVVTITPLVYGYFNLAYFQSYQGASLNPEAVAQSQTAVITIKT